MSRLISAALALAFGFSGIAYAQTPSQMPPGMQGRPAPSQSMPGAQRQPIGQSAEFKTEAEAKSRCPSDRVVWANLNTKVYHLAGTHNYGKTLKGAYMCERDANTAGMRAAQNEKAR